MKEGSSRKTENRRIRQEELRIQLKGKEYIRQVKDIDTELVSINKKVSKLNGKEGTVTKVDSKGTKVKVKKITNAYQNSLELEKAKIRTKILQSRIDLNFRRLAKVLPDLKSIELTDGEGENVLGTFTRALAEVVRGSSSS